MWVENHLNQVEYEGLQLIYGIYNCYGHVTKACNKLVPSPTIVTVQLKTRVLKHQPGGGMKGANLGIIFQQMFQIQNQIVSCIRRIRSGLWLKTKRIKRVSIIIEIILRWKRKSIWEEDW